MSSSCKAPKPIIYSRFKKGQNGNPKGRPKSGAKPIASAYDIIVNPKITITKDGVPREATVEEAPQLKTYRAALDGDRSVTRDVQKMIEIWNKVLTEKQQTGPKITKRVKHSDPDNAFDALTFLDIAVKNPNWQDHDMRLVLQPWAMEMARNRHGRKTMSRQNGETKKAKTHDSSSITLPESY
jgi:Family of unknown function (DUF5681)